MFKRIWEGKKTIVLIKSQKFYVIIAEFFATATSGNFSSVAERHLKRQ